MNYNQNIESTNAKQGIKTKRPVLVTIIAVLLLINAIATFNPMNFGAIVAMFGQGAISFYGFTVVQAIAYIIIAIGLLKMKEWSLYLGTIFMALGLSMSIYGYILLLKIPEFSLSMFLSSPALILSLVSALITIFILIYLWIIRKKFDQVVENTSSSSALKWFLLVFVVVAIIIAGYFGLRSTNKNNGQSSTTTPPKTQGVAIQNVTFYETSTTGLYSDEKSDAKSGIACDAPTTEIGRSGTIKVKYQNKNGSVNMLKELMTGMSNDCKFVKEGAFFLDMPWQTFLNDKYGFSFKYPSGWSKFELPADAASPNSSYSVQYPSGVFSSDYPGVPQGDFKVFITPLNKKVSDFEKNVEIEWAKTPNYKQSSITFLGLPAIKTTTNRDGIAGGDTTRIVFSKDKYQYTITGYDLDLFNQILSTFQFTK